MAAPRSSNPSAAPQLVAVGAATPQIYELRAQRVTIGTGAGNDLLLDEPTASRRHAALERRDGRWHVVDLGSTNGTYLNGRRVSAPSSPLKRGDDLRFGNARFAFVAPGDDLSRVGAAGAKDAARPPRRVTRVAGVVAAALLFAGGGFALTAYLLNFERPHRAAAVAPRGAATAAAVAPSVEATAASAGNAGAAGAPPAASPVAEAGAPGAPASATAPQWLARLNYYRAMLRLTPVGEDPALSEGDALHARYLVKSYADAIGRKNVGGEVHEEDRASPWYTEKGMNAGRSSDVSYWQAARAPVPKTIGDFGSSAGEMPWGSPREMPWGSPGWTIDGWMDIPFHRLSLISPYLRRSGYGRYCEGAGCAAALDTLSDRSRLPEYPVPFAHPLEFPPPDATIGMRSLSSEWPDPLTACPGYARPAGLAVTLALGAEVDARLGAFRLVRDGASSAGSSANLEVCGFDASSYNNPEPAAQQRGRDVLHAFGAVVMIPRAPLDKDASYTVSMAVNGQEYKWSFSTAP